MLDQVLDLARQGRTAELLELLDAGFPIDLANGRGDTLLIVATYQQQHDTVRALLERGADTDLVNAMGQTAVACAVFRNDGPLLEQLLDAGADPDLGAHPAVRIAEQFGLAGMAELLRGRAAASE